MKAKEIILNLWYVRDGEGIIYSLRARAYVKDGTEDEKLDFLRERALLDYLVADPFEIPKSHHLKIGVGPESKKMPVGHVAMLNGVLENPIALFEEAIKALGRRIPAQTKLSIPQDPLVCTTPLSQDAHGNIVPSFHGSQRFKR